MILHQTERGWLRRGNMTIEVYRDGRTTQGEAICPYCGVGCRLWMESAYGKIIRVKGVADAPANLGGLCARGAPFPRVTQPPARLMHPPGRFWGAGEPLPMSWDAAI